MNQAPTKARRRRIARMAKPTPPNPINAKLDGSGTVAEFTAVNVPLPEKPVTVKSPKLVVSYVLIAALTGPVEVKLETPSYIVEVELFKIRKSAFKRPIPVS